MWIERGKRKLSKKDNRKGDVWCEKKNEEGGKKKKKCYNREIGGLGGGCVKEEKRKRRDFHQSSVRAPVTHLSLHRHNCPTALMYCIDLCMFSAHISFLSWLNCPTALVFHLCSVNTFLSFLDSTLLQVQCFWKWEHSVGFPHFYRSRPVSL